MRENPCGHRDENVGLLFEDALLLVCVKPRGILSARDASQKKSMQDLLSPREVYPVHRLDKETVGLMVFAKDKDTAAFLSGQMGSSFDRVFCLLC